MRNQQNMEALIENVLVHSRRRSTSHLRLLERSRSLYEFKVEKVNGFPVSLSCHEKNSTSSTTKNATSKSTSPLLDSTIEFDYELMLRDPREDVVEVLQQDLPKWEFFLLYYVADDIGILGCDIEKQNITNSTDEASSVDVVSLSSYGTDVIDNRIASCQFLVDLEPGWICIPLQGTMKAEFVGQESDRAAVEFFLANHVAHVLNTSSDFFGIGVNKTVFVGSRVIPSPVVSDGRAVDDQSSSDDYVSALAGSLSAAAALLICIVLFALVRRRRRRPEETESTVGGGLDKEVIMGGSDIARTDVLPPGVPYTPTKSLDSKSDEDKSDEARCGSVDSLANRLGREVIDPLQAYPAAYALTNVRTASTVVSTEDESVVHLPSIDEETETKKNTLDSVTATVVGSTEVATSPMNDALPPKHPTGPSSKVPPVPAVAKLPKTRRRRKKKKKKVATIVRSNSRENVKEMETITEVEEETSGDNQDVGGSDDEDEGSWCSTSDSEPGSRDPSPARSSRNSSREPSPARSTGSNEEAVVPAAAVLPTWDTGRVIGPSSDTTSGTEKPKPKKLPPSWLSP